MSLTVEPQPVPLTTTAQGVVLVSGTRVPLETVIWAFSQGATPEEIAQDFPTLSLANVYSVVAYYLSNRDEVDAYVATQSARSAEVRAANEARFDRTGIRERLLARKKGQGAV